MNTAVSIQVRRTSKSHLNFDANLSRREYEICEQVILGNTQVETSTIFFRSPFTITQTIRNAFTKTGARNISELGVWYWCRKFNVTMIISDRKRQIIAFTLFLLFSIHDLVPMLKADMKEARRVEMRASRRKTDDNPNEDLLWQMD